VEGIFSGAPAAGDAPETHTGIGEEGNVPRLRGWRPALGALGALALAAAALLAGCNLLSPFAPDGDELSYRGLLLKGNQAINDGDYAAAADWFERAMRRNFRGSEAYLFHAKALAALYRIDYTTLNNEFNARRNEGGSGKKGVPFIDTGTTVEEIDSTFYPVAQAVENLEHILRPAHDTVLIPGGWLMLPDGDTAGDGRISEGVARLDLGLLETLKGMLGPLDLDGDNHVSRQCGRNVCPDTAASGSACRRTRDYLDRCPEGPASEANRLERFKLLTRNIDIDSLDSKDVQAKQVSSNPNDINGFLDRMQGPIAASGFNLETVTGAMNSHNETKLSGQLTDIVTDVTNLGDFLGYMRYNDRADNDFDAQDPPRGERMIWHDYNKDGGIRFDYDDTATFAGYYQPGRNGECVNIGHPLHRYLHPELYVKFSDPEWTSRPAAADASKNSRKSIMIKHCADVAAALDVGGKVTEELKETLRTVTCSTYASFPKPEVGPPKRSDWQGGTFGVDEELFDDRDNDYDGLKDEDTRNAPGMDDDNDGILTVEMVGTAPAPMAWSEASGHENACPDMDTTRAMPPAPFQRRFCIGSLENRIYLARQYGRDSLRAYYSAFVDNAESGDANCLEDAKKLPEEFQAAAIAEAGSARQYGFDVDLACQYKHIWRSGIPPPHSEWTAGVFGVDEEIPDGIDNDGDGWIDEDLR
jgi:hypothetical protein